MRVALCFHGLIGGTVGKYGKGGNIDYRVAYNHFKRHILDKNNVDVFMHSWSVEEKDNLVNIYKPKDYIFEPQIKFNDGDKIYTKHDKWYNQDENRKHMTRSRWYGQREVVKLKQKYEKQNNFVYDWVMISRFDVAFFTDVVFSNYDNNYFYVSNFNDAVNKVANRTEPNRINHTHAFLDFWFFSNSYMMDKFSILYDNIDNYSINQHAAAKEHTLTFTNKIKYVLYRWYDHEIIRRILLDATE